jgi:hypothetical protein
MCCRTCWTEGSVAPKPQEVIVVLTLRSSAIATDSELAPTPVSLTGAKIASLAMTGRPEFSKRSASETTTDRMSDYIDC